MPNLPATIGNRNVVSVLNDQTENEPIEDARARILLGNISDKITQITTPWEEAKNAANPIK